MRTLQLTASDVQTRAATVRRTPRILRRVPLRLESELGVACGATTAAINAHGALVLSPEPFPAESRVLITNLDRGSVQLFRVVRSRRRKGRLFELGVELLAPRVDFWGLTCAPGADD